MLNVGKFIQKCGGKAGKAPVIAVAGSTGAVGVEFLRLMEERSTTFSELRLLASSRSAGKKQKFRGQEVVVQEMTKDSFKDVDVAFFSAGGAQSKSFCPVAADAGAVVIDNSSAFRMDPEVPLVVPEVNARQVLNAPKGIIANPNCSTILMNVVAYPIHVEAGLKRVVVSTYQASSGAGAAAMEELKEQARAWVSGKPLPMDIFKRQYIFNLFSHNSKMDPDSGYVEEELKLVNETAKIFAGSEAAKKWKQPFGVTGTCVRVPTLRAHCESINIETHNPISPERARELLAKAPGVTVVDDRVNNKFPEPVDASHKDDCLVGRIRTDATLPDKRGLWLFMSGDQIRKGAALNGIQIMELLLASKGK